MHIRLNGSIEWTKRYIILTSVAIRLNTTGKSGSIQLSLGPKETAPTKSCLSMSNRGPPESPLMMV